MTPASDTPAVLYLRVSTDKQGESGLGLEAQEARCRDECERRGWRIVEVVTEIQSGAKDERSGFRRACELARENRGVVVSAEASRFSRGSVSHVLQLYEQAAREGYALFAIDMPEIDLTSPMGEFLLTVLAGVNRLERRLTAQRTSRAIRAKIARGEPWGRRKGEHLMPQATVKRIHQLRDEGQSLRAIAATLNAENVPTVSGGAWKHSAVQRVLS